MKSGEYMLQLGAKLDEVLEAARDLASLQPLGEDDAPLSERPTEMLPTYNRPTRREAA